MWYYIEDLFECEKCFNDKLAINGYGRYKCLNKNCSFVGNELHPRKRDEI